MNSFTSIMSWRGRLQDSKYDRSVLSRTQRAPGKPRVEPAKSFGPVTYSCHHRYDPRCLNADRSCTCGTRIVSHSFDRVLCPAPTLRGGGRCLSVPLGDARLASVLATKGPEGATGKRAHPAVSDRIVFELQSIPLPSLLKQRRIAEILDKADALRAKRRAALAQLDTLTQSIFLDMFGDSATNPKGWHEVVLGAYTSKIGSGATPLGGEAAYKKDGIALIRSMNVRDGRFSQDGLAFIDAQQAARLDGVVVEPNDVLLNITGASVARVCRAPRDVLPARVNQHVAIIRPTSSFDLRFLEQCLLFPSMKRRLLRIAGAGATREAITKDAIERLTVIQPPRNEQDRFADMLVACHGLEVAQGRHLMAADALFSSLQHRAFRGDL